jgi:hypothetical protein
MDLSVITASQHRKRIFAEIQDETAFGYRCSDSRADLAAARDDDAGAEAADQLPSAAPALASTLGPSALASLNYVAAERARER